MQESLLHCAFTRNEIDKNKDKAFSPSCKRNKLSDNSLLSFLLERINKVASSSAEDKTSASQSSPCLHTLPPPTRATLEVISPPQISGKELDSQWIWRLKMHTKTQNNRNNQKCITSRILWFGISPTVSNCTFKENADFPCTEGGSGHLNHSWHTSPALPLKAYNGRDPTIIPGSIFLCLIISINRNFF